MACHALCIIYCKLSLILVASFTVLFFLMKFFRATVFHFQSCDM